MKKFLAILLTFVCLLTLGACGAKDDEGQLYFIAKVVELNEETMLIEITDKGNSNLELGTQASVSTEKVAGVTANNPEIVTNNYLRIEFDGTVMETAPVQLGEIFKIDITNENGESIE